MAPVLELADDFEVEMPWVGSLEVAVQQLEAVLHGVEAMNSEMAVHWDFEVVVHQAEAVNNLEVMVPRLEAMED